VALGYSNKEIADRLFVSVNTIQTTLQHVFRKLDIDSRTELASRISDGNSDVALRHLNVVDDMRGL